MMTVMVLLTQSVQPKPNSLLKGRLLDVLRVICYRRQIKNKVCQAQDVCPLNYV